MTQASIHWIRAALVAFALTAATGCAEQAPSPGPASEPPSLAELENMTFEGVYDTPVTLSSGVYRGESFDPDGEMRPQLELVEDSFLTGDFDGDGANEAAVLLSESSGGSGVFTYLAIASGTGQDVRNIATTELGDRVVVQSMEARDNAVVMDLVVAGLDDAACCPTRKVRNTYRIEGGRLTVKSKEMGRLSVADLSGPTWRLTHWAWNEPLEVDIEITATFADGTVSGTGGCNQYHAGIESAEGAELSVGPAAVTRTACPEPIDDAERRYLTALGNVIQFSFRPGKLILAYQEGEDFRSLVFTATE